MTASAIASNIIPFGFEDHLVRVYKPNGEPWFVGKDVCTVLEIRDHNQALNRLDDDERSGCTVPTPRGEQTMIVVSEAGVFRLIFSSRKPEAERFKKWLAHEVLPQLRRHGFYALPGPKGAAVEALSEFPAGDDALGVHLAKLATLKECRMIHGPRAAARLWRRLGMPQVSESVVEEVDEGRRCLAYLLDSPSVSAPVVFDDTAASFRLRSLIESALSDVEASQKILRDRFNLLAVAGHNEGLFVPNSAEKTVEIFKGSPWANGRHMQALRRLPGWQPMLKSVQRQCRGTFIPAAVIDSIAFGDKDEETTPRSA